MRSPHPPLSAAETEELAQLLADYAERSLPFARGVFAAVATAPTPLDPTQWVPLLLNRELPDRAVLQRFFALAVRECAACAECLALSVPAVPPAVDAAAVRDFCKGYVRVAQRDKPWTTDTAAYERTVLLAWLADYVGTDALARIAPPALDDPDAYRAQLSEQLPDTVAELYAHFTPARHAQGATTASDPKVGRNDPCPCGSGRKYKKCCLT